MKNFFDLKKEYLSETRYDVSWGVGVETQVIAKDPNEARKKAKEMILKRIPKLADPKYSDVWEKNPRIHKISENTDIDETLDEVEIDEGSIKGSGTDRKAQLKKAYRSGEQDTRQFNKPGGMPTNKPNRTADTGIKTAYEKGRMSSGGDSPARGAARTTSQDTLHGTNKVPDWAKGSRGEKKIRRDTKAYALGTSKPRGKLPEEVEIDEAVEVRHDRYMRSHGRKARDGYGMWMFTDKDRGDVDYKDEKQVHTVTGNFGDAKKSAQQWGKKHGHSAVYVMEEVELDEVSDKMLDRYRQKAFADQPSGDDGSDKYRKRKFGRDLAFAKQTGRAKVLATKESVDLDEAVNTKKIAADYDAGHSIDVIVQKHLNKKGDNKDEILKAVRDHRWKTRMKKEEVEIDEASITNAKRVSWGPAAKKYTIQQVGDAIVKNAERYSGTNQVLVKKLGQALLNYTDTNLEVLTPKEIQRIAKSLSINAKAAENLITGGISSLGSVKEMTSPRLMEVEQVDEVSSELAQRVYKKRMDQSSAALKRDDYAGMRKAEKKAGETHSRMVKKILRREEVENDTSINLHEDPWEEIPMMKRQLNYIIYAAEEIAEYLDLGADPEEWYQNKLAEVFSKMQDLHAYMEGDEEDEDDDDDDDMEEMRDPAHPYLHGGKHSKNLSTMGWPTKDVKIHQGFGKHYINVHQYKESLDEMEGSAKRNRELYATGRISKDEFDRRMGYGKYKNFKDAPNKRLDGPGGIYKNLVKRFGEETEIEEKLKVSDGVGSWIDDFQKSDAPQFKGKSKKDRRNMALAAYLSAKKKNESKEE
jgi:hypothetical protein